MKNLDLDITKTVRVHIPIMRERWARLYCYCRFCADGSGRAVLSWKKAKADLYCSAGTLYEWLAIMKRVGAVRFYRRVKDELTVYLGGLLKFARNLGIENLGAITRLPLGDLLASDNKSLEARSHATAITTQQLQNNSRYAARRCNKTKTRIPNASDVLQTRKAPSSRLPGNGPMVRVPRVLHVSKRKVFVSAGFVPFGVSQEAIASHLGISARTVRRHLSHLGVMGRQVCQAKKPYKEIRAALEWEAEKWDAGDGVVLRKSRLEEPHSKTSQAITPNRFFTYMGKTWLLRCNLYHLNYDLISARKQRRIYKNLITRDRRTEQSLDKAHLSKIEGRLAMSLPYKSLRVRSSRGGEFNFSDEDPFQTADKGEDQNSKIPRTPPG